MNQPNEAIKIKAKIILVCAGGEVVVSTAVHFLDRLMGNNITATPIQWKDLPYTTAHPSEIILVELTGNSTTYVFERTLKHGERSFTHTYKNRENPSDVVRLVHIS